MAERTRRFTVMALLLLVPFTIACGGAEEPAPQPAEQPADVPAPEPAPEPAPVEQPPADATPEEPVQQGPQLVGNITLSNENFEWGATDNQNASYTWTVRVANDTTASLDITVRFQFLDDNDQVIKTETKTVRLDPATSTTLRENGRMSYAQANRVYSFSAAFDYQIVSN